MLAAAALSAALIVANQAGLVSCADLSHLDPGAVLSGQTLNQIAEVDSGLGCEIKNYPLAAKQVLHRHQLHFQIQLFHLLTAVRQRLARRAFQVPEVDHVLRVGLTQHLAPAMQGILRAVGLGVIGQTLRRDGAQTVLVTHLQEYLAQLHAAIGSEHHSAVRRRRGVDVVGELPNVL